MLGCYGNTEFKTPNIDTLARSGVRFINSFAGSPVCSPSRAAMFTGRVPRQHGIHEYLSPGQAEPPASFHQETMISDVLARAGYTCGYIGKWHLGRDEQPGHGYQYTYTMRGGAHRYQDPELFLNGQATPEKGYLAELMTQRASEFLDRQTAAKPFFLTVGYLNPSTPYDGHPQKYLDLYSSTKFETVGWQNPVVNARHDKEMLADNLGNLRRAAASLTALDDQLLVLLRKLEQKGFRDNTLVIFTSDNGALLGRHGLWSNGLASDPANMFEEVVRTPMIWVWPGKAPTSEIITELISGYDLMPTLCEAAGAALPPQKIYSGRNYLPLVLRQPLTRERPWRNLVFGHFRETEMARDNRFKLVLRNEGKGPNEFYDLTKDPREKVNQYENAEYITIRDRLGRDLAEWRKRTSS